MTARSPRASELMAWNAFIVNVLAIAAGMAFAGVVAVWFTVAVLRVTVTVTVRSVLATWTVTVCVAGVGVSMAAAVSGLPASRVVAGIMLPDCMACRVAGVFAVRAAVPAVVAETFWNFVPADTSHRCSSPLADCKMMNWFVARTTMPRWTASVWPWCEVWLKPRIEVIRASWEYVPGLEEFQSASAAASMLPSLPDRALWAAGAAAIPAEWLLAATATAAIAPLPSTTAVAMPARVFRAVVRPFP